MPLFTSLISLGLINGVRRNYFDTLNFNSFCRLTGLSGPIPDDWNAGNFFEYVIAFDQFAESRVLVVQGGRGAMADEKLTPGGVRTSWRAGHRDYPAHMWPVVKLGFYFVPGV